MKKVILCAVMMTAFSGISKASTIADENALENKLMKSESISTMSLSGTCTGVWHAVRIYALNHGSTEGQADCIAWAALIRCMGFDDLQKANAQLDAGPAC